MRFSSSSEIYHWYGHKKKVRSLKILEIILIVVLLIAGATLVIENVLEKIDKSNFKIKGKLVDIGKYSMLYNVTGEGKVSVILEADIGTPIQQWSKVKEEISKGARVFTYDRAGYGWSEASPEASSIEQEVKDLKALLKKSAVRAPYILVGHGYGGMIMCHYAKQYPDEVMGIILIDSYNEKDIATDSFKQDLKKEIAKASVYKYSSYFGLLRVADKYKLLKTNQYMINNLPEESKNLFKTQIITPKYNKSIYNELKILLNYSDNVQVKGMLGEKPLVVFTTTNNNLDEESKKQRLFSQKDLLNLSSKSEQNIIYNSSTYVHMENPNMIINGINAMLKKAVK